MLRASAESLPGTGAGGACTWVSRSGLARADDSITGSAAASPVGAGGASRARLAMENHRRVHLDVNFAGLRRGQWLSFGPAGEWRVWLVSLSILPAASLTRFEWHSAVCNAESGCGGWRRRQVVCSHHRNWRRGQPASPAEPRCRPCRYARSERPPAPTAFTLVDAVSHQFRNDRRRGIPGQCPRTQVVPCASVLMA